MKNDKLSVQLKQLETKAIVVVGRFRNYGLVIFLIFVACIYGFLLLRVHTLDNNQPSADAVTSQVKAARLPHIDQSVVNQLQTLRDNSVNVQALFDQGRNNPFQ